MIEPINKPNDKRRSSYVSSLSPYIRRNSFLSRDMIEDENFLVYESASFYSDSSSYNIISLKECQGFIFNQDLFASPYQQSRSLANEKQRALSYSRIKHSRQGSLVSSINSQTSSQCPIDAKQRRHTSYHATRPALIDDVDVNVTATVFEDDEDVEMEEAEEEVEEEEEEEEKDEEILDSAIDDYEDDYEEMNDYGGDANNRRYKVHVTDIVINESEADIFPK